MEKRRRFGGRGRLWRGILSTALSVMLVLQPIPMTEVAAQVLYDDDLVSSVAEAYNGDEARARELLDALNRAGIIDDEGHMVELDIREDGEPVALEDASDRIANGGEYGSITVNGRSVPGEQLVKIRQAKEALELVRVLGEPVEVTDEHVDNLESLLKAIADGEIDFEKAMQQGAQDSAGAETDSSDADDAVSLDGRDADGADDAMPLDGRDADAPGDAVPLYGQDVDGVQTDPVAEEKDAEGAYDNASASDQVLGGAQEDTGAADGAVLLGAQGTTSGTVSVDNNGAYTAPFISGAVYESTHNFKLPDPTNNAWYEENSTSGIVMDGVVSLNFKNTNTVTISTSAETGYVVEATLNKPQPVPVTLDLTAAGEALGVKHAEKLTWNAGDSGVRKSTIKIPKKAVNDPWDGTRSFVVNARVRNAQMQGGGTVSSTTVGVKAQDEMGWVQVDKYDNSWAMNRDKSWDADKYWNKMVNYIKAGDRIRVKLKSYANAPGNNTHYSRLLLAPSITKIINNNSNTFGQGNTKSYGYNPITTFEGTHEINSVSGVDLDKESIFDGSGRTCLVIETIHGGDKNNTVDFTVEKYTSPSVVKVNSVSVTAGTYYSGQIVPVTVNLSDIVKAGNSAKLVVNGAECALIDGKDIMSSKLTFGYKVPNVADGSLSVTDINGLVSLSNVSVTLQGEFPKNEFSPTNGGVTLSSKVKEVSLNLEDAKYGIDDDIPGRQQTTVLIPFTSGAKKTWVANDVERLDNPMPMPVPGYMNATAIGYLRSAYLSYDRGTTRYPVYVLKNGNDEAVSLAARLAPPGNDDDRLRRDTLNLYLDEEFGTENVGKYLGAWSEAKRDALGYAYFVGAEKAEAPIISGGSWNYYVKGVVRFDPDASTVRSGSGGAYDVNDGWLGLGDGSYVVLQDPEHPEKQYDVEIVANEAVRRSDVRLEEGRSLTLGYQISGRKPFTFMSKENFTWTSSNEAVAKVVVGDDGLGHVELTDKPGEAEFTLKVGNGSDEKAYTVAGPKITVFEGKDPFLSISEFSRKRKTLAGADTDVMFSSNITACNVREEISDTTTFTATLYGTTDSGGVPKRTGEALWSGDFTGTVEDPVTHVTIPGGEIAGAGTYAVEVSSKYKGSTLAAEAIVVAEQAPVEVRLGQLESYSVTAADVPKITYEVSQSDAEVEYTVQKSGEAVGDRKQATGGTIPFAPDTSMGLKEAYTITVYARRRNSDDAWSVDSMMLNVYNPDVLRQIVADVAPGAIGGTTGGSGADGGIGVVATGKTVRMDNHVKVSEALKKGNDYELTFEDFTALRTDMSLQKVVSANYGEAAYGLISDAMQWESSDADTVSVEYKQGGLYSDIRNFDYTSYLPVEDLLLVGKGETKEGEPVTITATHAATGINSSFQVETTTLKDQLYVFRFSPAAKTSVTYTNGNGTVRKLETNDKGELAVYEPDGITGTVMALSQDGDETYVGTMYPQYLESGERDVGSLQLYPCNNLPLRSISKVELTFKKPDGKNYNGQVTIRGGVYKNDRYCPGALISTDGGVTKRDGRQDIAANVKNGKLVLSLDPTQFRVDPDDEAEATGAKPGDALAFVFEYRFAGSYRPGIVTLDTSTDEYGSSRTDTLVQMRGCADDKSQLEIIDQTLQQYYGDVALSYKRSIIDCTEDVGINSNINKAEIETMVALNGVPMSRDEKGFSIYSSSTIYAFSLYMPSGKRLTGQMDATLKEAEQIQDLRSIRRDTMLYVYPFSSFPIARNVYTMDDVGMSADGITDVDDSPNFSTNVIAKYYRNGLTIKSETLKFRVANLSHQKDLLEEGGAGFELGNDLYDVMNKRMSFADSGNKIREWLEGHSDIVSGAFSVIHSLNTEFGIKITPMFFPTENPGVWKVVVAIGSDKQNSEYRDDNKDYVIKEIKGGELKLNVANMYEGKENTKKEWQKVCDQLENKDVKHGDPNKGKYNFYGLFMLELRHNDEGGWSYVGWTGKAGLNSSWGYEYNYNFYVGVPANINVTLSADIDGSFSIGQNGSAWASLIELSVGFCIEAFFGIGFDISLLAAKCGVYGNVRGQWNPLLYSRDSNNDNENEKGVIDKAAMMARFGGQIGAKLLFKVLFVEYEKVWDWYKFGWDKWTWKSDDYDWIRQDWKSLGHSNPLVGQTDSGRDYSLRLAPNGEALVEIDSGMRLEDRDYLLAAQSEWNDVAVFGDGSMDVLQSNAYPFAQPVLSDDGEVMLYISDNGNADSLENVLSYAVKDGAGYTEMGAVDTSDGSVHADTDAVASGTREQAFAAWVRQLDSPDKEMGDEITTDDLGQMLASAEVYVGAFEDGKWTTQRLTDNSVADMAPAVASSGKNAIVAWRSLSASSMAEEGDDITAMFDTENTLNYRMYKDGRWQEAKTAYNGSAGTVNAVDCAMLADGRAIIAYTVRTGEDVASTETFYTVVGADGEALTTGRLTNDNTADTNAQATTVGGNFVVGWYSEHASSEADASHDIRLARIDCNGSVDAAFPENLDGEAARSATSNFRFSAPAGNNDLNNLSIVWSQKKDDGDEDAEDSGKYQLNAVRFYTEKGGEVGISPQTTLVESGSYYTIDTFDTYTDTNGAVNAVILGSDYSSIDGIQTYDTIDLSEQPIEIVDESGEGHDMLDILAQDPIVSIRLAKGGFAQTAIEAKADYDPDDILPGFEIPVQFSVSNVGVGTIDNVSIQIGEKSAAFEGLDLRPGQSTTLTVDYPVPETVRDVDYAITANGSTAATGTLALNRPGVGISSMKVVDEHDGIRNVQVMLANSESVPLAGSGKTVKLAFYGDDEHEQQIGDVITVDSASYQDIDDGIYVHMQQIDVRDLIDGASEVPDEGVSVYASAWVEDAVDPYTQDDDACATLRGLLSKRQSQITMDASLSGGDGDYTITAEISNNSLQKAKLGVVTAEVFDADGNLLASVPVSEGRMSLDGEHAENVVVPDVALEGQPARVELVSEFKSVRLDANGGRSDVISMGIDKEGRPCGELPEATMPGHKFLGWYTEAEGGAEVTRDTVLAGGSTIYARYTDRYDIVVNAAENGSVTVSVGGEQETTAEKDDIVTLIPTPADGYVLRSLTVRDAEGNEVEMSEGSFTMPEGDVTVTAVFGAQAPKFERQSLVLGGRIGVNFFLDLSALSDEERKASHMEFTVNGRTMTADFDEDFKNNDGRYYGFTCYVSSIQMAEDIEAVYHYGDKNVSWNYSVLRYINDFERLQDGFDEKTRNLVRSIADYGHYAQPFLAAHNGWKIGDDYAEMTKSYGADYDYGQIKEALSSKAMEADYGVSDIEKITYALNLDAETSIYVYVRPKAGYDGDLAVTVDGSEAVATQLEDGRYRVEIPNISAHRLGEDRMLEFRTQGGTATMKVSAMSYVHALLSADDYADNTVAKSAVAALYKYYEAAKAYRKG